MARLSFTLRKNAAEQGSALRTDLSTEYAGSGAGGASAAVGPRTDSDSALRAGGLLTPPESLVVDPFFEAYSSCYGDVDLAWSVPLESEIPVSPAAPVPFSVLLVYSPNGEPQTIASGTILVESPTIRSYRHSGLREGEWAYYSLFVEYRNTEEVYYERASSISILTPRNYGSNLMLWDRIPAYYRTQDQLLGSPVSAEEAHCIGNVNEGDIVGPLFKYLSIIGFDIDYIRTLIDYVMVSRDPHVANSVGLDSIAHQMGVRLQSADLGAARLRNLLGDIGFFRRSKGTLEGTLFLAQSLLGSEAAIDTENHEITVYAQRVNYVTSPADPSSIITHRPAWSGETVESFSAPVSHTHYTLSGHQIVPEEFDLSDQIDTWAADVAADLTLHWLWPFNGDVSLHPASESGQVPSPLGTPVFAPITLPSLGTVQGMGSGNGVLVAVSSPDYIFNNMAVYVPEGGARCFLWGTGGSIGEYAGLYLHDYDVVFVTSVDGEHEYLRYTLDGPGTYAIGAKRTGETGMALYVNGDKVGELVPSLSIASVANTMDIGGCPEIYVPHLVLPGDSIPPSSPGVTPYRLTGGVVIAYVQMSGAVANSSIPDEVFADYYHALFSVPNALVHVNSPVSVRAGDRVNFSIHSGVGTNALRLGRIAANDTGTVLATAAPVTINGVPTFSIESPQDDTVNVEFYVDLSQGPVDLANMLLELNYLGSYFDGDTKRGGWLVDSQSISDYRWSGDDHDSPSVYSEDYERTKHIINLLVYSVLPITEASKYQIVEFSGQRGAVT